MYSRGNTYPSVPTIQDCIYWAYSLLVHRVFFIVGIGVDENSNNTAGGCFYWYFCQNKFVFLRPVFMMKLYRM